MLYANRLKINLNAISECYINVAFIYLALNTVSGFLMFFLSLFLFQTLSDSGSMSVNYNKRPWNYCLQSERTSGESAARRSTQGSTEIMRNIFFLHNLYDLVDKKKKKFCIPWRIKKWKVAFGDGLSTYLRKQTGTISASLVETSEF